ncbi:MAG: glycosyltransferase family 2 protein [Flavobacteriales bacterium]|nr:glycosyltransferase family 2 protein [Flavobacteriales bacterium]
MLSICIPVFQRPIQTLVDDLLQQSRSLEVEVEIILIDDASDTEIRQKNRQIHSEINYIQLDENIGRARIRNRFLEHASHGHLLFLDCDGLVCRDDFLKHYIDSIRSHPDKVICGGRLYPQQEPPTAQRLRWTYGRKRESRSAAQRNTHPHQGFMTNNFVILKSVLAAIPFDERLTDYGHEDTLMGIELRRRGVDILHIDNPILNDHLEENDVFLMHTDKALSNLHFIVKNTSYAEELFADVRLLRIYRKSAPLRFILGPLFRVLSPMIRRSLAEGSSSLLHFDLYRLGMLQETFRLGADSE